VGAGEETRKAVKATSPLQLAIIKYFDIVSPIDGTVQDFDQGRGMVQRNGRLLCSAQDGIIPILFKSSLDFSSR
jgi:hypothetical protein